MARWIVVGSPGFWIWLGSSLSGLVVGMLAWIAHRVRVRGARLARRQAAIDFPDDEVVAAHVFVAGSYRYAEIVLRGAGARVYQIARREEAAFRVEDPRAR